MAIHSLSICTGGAGLELACSGLFEPVAYTECEASAAAILAQRMEEKAIPQAPIWSDVRTLCDTDFRDYIRERTGGQGIGLLCGGYPCQDFSHAGNRAGLKGSRGGLWRNIYQAIILYRPELCFFENVEGHVTLGFDVVCRCLQRVGYEVTAGLFTAAEVGASQKRKRLFILAYAGHERPRSGNERVESDTPEHRRNRLADTNNVVAVATSIQRPRRPKPEGFERQATIDNASGDVAVAGEPRLQRGQQPETLGSIDGKQASGSIAEFRYPLFPPGPGELDAWREVLGIAPSIEPAICRMADGMAHRMERLRLLGNGVVPLQAAYAFATLAASFM